MQFTPEARRLAELLQDFPVNPIPLKPRIATALQRLAAALQQYRAPAEDLVGAPISGKNGYTRPTQFQPQHIPAAVWQQLDRNAKEWHVGPLTVGFRTIEVFLVSPKKESAAVVHDALVHIFTWLLFLDKLSSRRCVRHLRVHVFWTPLRKEIPDHRSTVLAQTHVNTALTTSCPADAEIVVFRREEWLKVLLHETFHTFGLDFSSLSVRPAQQCMRRLFPGLQSDFLLFEAYTETWAEILNVLLVAPSPEVLLPLDQAFSLLQLAKVLDHMGMQSWEDLVRKQTQWQEESNVFAYYVVRAVLLQDINQFVGWCLRHNGSGTHVLQFPPTQTAVRSFCDLILARMADSALPAHVEAARQFLLRHPKNAFIRKSLRMTVVEKG